MACSDDEVPQEPPVGSEDSSEDSSSEDSSYKAAEHPLATPLDMLPRIAELVGKMAITKPEVLRVTRACQAFQNCAEAFRADKEFFDKSQSSRNISRFWSHSWHGSSWTKVLTLLELYNGWASILLGTFAASVAMGLFSFGLLPGFSRAVPGGEEIFWSCWSMATGLVVSVTCFIFWKPQQEVFFDRICISEDPQLKSHAIFSLAGMLKKSQEMLVLWDPSWSDRLWCLFELAAFLKCKKSENEKVLIIRPTFLGPCSITAFLAVSAAMLGLTTLPMPLGFGLALLVPIVGLMVFGGVVGVFALASFRAYFRSVQILEEKLRSKTFDTVRSSCCAMNHVNANGRPTLCDRQIVEQCVTMWFGSIQAFEESFRSELSNVITEELRQNVFTQGWILKVSTPIVWAFMDFVATNINIGHWAIATESSVLGLVVCVLCAPMFGEFGIFLTRRYCSRATCCGGGIFSDVLVNLALISALGVIAALMGGLLLATYWTFHSSPALTRGFAVFGTFCSLHIITYACKSVYLMTRRKAMVKYRTNCQAVGEMIGRPCQ